MSKEKQIEEIRKDIFAAFGGYAKWEEDWQSLAEAVYNAGYRKQEWTSVDERLPDIDERCLLSMENRVTKYRWVTIDYYHTNYDKYVTHWMPLPEPPKKGGE